MGLDPPICKCSCVTMNSATVHQLKHLSNSNRSTVVKIIELLLVSGQASTFTNFNEFKLGIVWSGTDKF